MAEESARIQEVLDGLADGRNRWGAALVTRDGIPLASRMARAASEESFAAMCAATIAAAEGAFQEWSTDKPLRAVVDGREVRLVVEGIDRDHLLAIMAPVAPPNGAVAGIELDAAVARLRTLLRPVAAIARA